jgi:putative membrane protein
MKGFTKGMLLAALTVLALPFAARAEDRKASDTEPTTDQEFLAKAIDINSGEVKMAEKALKESENKAVRAFAQEMIDGHTKLRNDFMRLAKSKRVAVVEGLGATAREQMTNLGKLRGRDFDREYISYQIADHEKALKLFKTWSKKATDSELRELSSKEATKVEEHLRLAKDVQAKLKGR